MTEEEKYRIFTGFKETIRQMLIDKRLSSLDIAAFEELEQMLHILQRENKSLKNKVEKMRRCENCRDYNGLARMCISDKFRGDKHECHDNRHKFWEPANV